MPREGSHPKLYDAQGRALEVGSRVERNLRINNQFEKLIPGRVLVITSDAVWVEFVAGRPSDFPIQRRHLLLRRSYRCNDLLLITDEEKGPVDV